MKTVIGGDGSDTTAAVKAYLLAGNKFRLPTLYLIGEADDPNAIWITDYESPLVWPIWGKFLNANTQRDSFQCTVGLTTNQLNLTWRPPIVPFSNSANSDSPYRKAWLGYYDNWKFRAWTAYVPTKGDANTYGASESFGGWISDTEVSAGSIKFTVNSFLSVIDQKVPGVVIEILNTVAGYTAATPPAGLTQVPRFSVVAGSTVKQLICDCTFPNAGQIFATNIFQYGYVVFDNAPGETLGGFFSSVRGNAISGGTHNAIQLLAPLPWSPTPGVDTFYVSAAAPINQADGNYYGFPFVPPPESL